MRRNLILILIAILYIVLFNGCKSCKKEVPNQEVQVEVDEEVINDINKAKKIFYSLPSPLETAMLIKTAGSVYN